MRRIGVPVVLSIALLSFTATAQAAQRYASPGGSGEACSSAAPCSLRTAVEKAGFNDEVIVGSGTYSVTSPISSVYDTDLEQGTELYIHGDFAGPMPKIVNSGLEAEPAIGTNTGDSLAYLEISAAGPNAEGLECFGAEVDRVVVTVEGSPSLGISDSAGCTLRDSLIEAQGSEANGISVAGFGGNGTVLLRNLTVEASGPGSIGIAASFPGSLFEPGSITANLANVIANGERYDLWAIDGGEGPGKIVVSHSNFDTAKGEGAATITNAGGNQTAAPLFVDAASGDFREAAGSPTIDAGANDQIGPFDLAGNPRLLGSAPDIGAYEFVPPPGGGGSSGGGSSQPQQASQAKIQTLLISPPKFRAANIGGAVISRAGKHRVKAPVGATVDFTLSGAVTVAFSVEKRLTGRKVGKRCVGTTRANRGKPKCAFFQRKGSFKQTGTAGLNRFKFSGRVGNKTLRPGRYRLVASSGGATKSAGFKIVQ
ncbi:MAG: choice-of-anchor Q domain-containing protein [Solirubrobacterales bacterium]